MTMQRDARDAAYDLAVSRSIFVGATAHQV
ncbi:hypothetical protein MPTA5024_08060 [Microbispora sp. ATCC PTA-5024]|nr:hypothetical protein MPTA5024_08060 [Microbispora sp. ATCC PTA-5024]